MVEKTNPSCSLSMPSRRGDDDNPVQQLHLEKKDKWIVKSEYMPPSLLEHQTKLQSYDYYGIYSFDF